MGFNWLDYLVLFVYLAGLMLVATKFLHEQHNSKEFFVAGNSIPWWGAGMSILATLVSTVSILGGPARLLPLRFRGVRNLVSGDVSGGSGHHLRLYPFLPESRDRLGV